MHGMSMEYVNRIVMAALDSPEGKEALVKAFVRMMAGELDAPLHIDDPKICCKHHAES